MPGFEVTPVEALKPGLRCCECGLLLREAVQTEEGERLCRSCYEIIKTTGTSSSGISLAGGCYPDRAVDKEVLRLLVRCDNYGAGCVWTGALQDVQAHTGNECPYQLQHCSINGCTAELPKLRLLQHMENECPFRSVCCEYCRQKVVFKCLEVHYNTCREYPVTCDRCYTRVKKDSLEDHLTNHCTYVVCMCGQQLKKDSMERHLSNPANLPGHMKLLMSVCTSVQSSQEHIQSQLKETLTVQVAEPRPSEEQFLRIEAELRTRQKEIDSRVSQMEVNMTSVRQEKEKLDSIRGDMQAVADSNKSRLDAHEEQLLDLQKKVVHNGKQRGGTHQYSDHYLGGSLEKRVENIERHMTLLKTHMSDLQLQLQASLASTHNGAFLWRIPEVQRRRQDARDERITSIYSPPFYTGRNGYKMCVRAYLSGDGVGHGTHLSLFFVLMRGEYDPLLRWPFEHKVSLILVDQNHRKHIVQTFKPTPDSTSFQRPKSDMNVASGCPQFAPLSVLDDLSYVKDDIIYIKCIVDVTKIFHP